MLKEYDLTGKVAIVTGAAKGIGKGIALTLADAGADIAAADIDADGLKKLCDDITTKGRRCLTTVTDVTDEAQVQHMVSEATSRLGQVDILVNNAGKSNRRLVVPLEGMDIKTITDENWESVMNLNVKGILHCARAVGPHMIKRRKGKIIIIISAVAVASFDYNSLYCISKAAAARFVQTLAREWAPYNINVNGIGPSWTMTEAAQMMLEYKGEEYVKKEMARMPLGRAAQPREIGLLAVYLASEASDMVTGQNIFIDGGLTGAV